MASATLRPITPPKRILVVEDDQLLAHMIEVALKADGHEVQVAQNAEQAVKLAEASPHDLVITDFVLPKMDGLDLAELLKRLSPATPILLITAYAERIQPQMGKVSNIDALLKKPFFVGQLQEAIAKFFPATTVA